MIVRKIPVGPLQSNCFIVADEKTKECFIVDPGDEPDRIIDEIDQNGFLVKYIVCTHAHFDHAGAIAELKEATKGKIVLHEDDFRMYGALRKQAAVWGLNAEDQPKPDWLVREGDSIKIGQITFEILHTPGHTPGGICLYGEGMVFTGDVLFAGSVGRTDFPGGDAQALKRSFKRLISLPESVKVLPGHGPDSTIGKEKKDNFFIYEI